MSARSLFENGAAPGFTFKTPIPASDDGYALTYNSADSVVETTNNPVAGATSTAETMTFTIVANSDVFQATATKYSIVKLDDGKFLVTLVVDRPNAISASAAAGTKIIAPIPATIPKVRVSLDGQVVGSTVVVDNGGGFLPAIVSSDAAGDNIIIEVATAITAGAGCSFQAFTATWISA